MVLRITMVQRGDAGVASHLTILWDFTWGYAGLALELMRTQLEGWPGGILVCSGQNSESWIPRDGLWFIMLTEDECSNLFLSPGKPKVFFENRWKGKCYPFSPFHGFFHVDKLKALKSLQRPIGLSWSHFPISTYLKILPDLFLKDTSISQDVYLQRCPIFWHT